MKKIVLFLTCLLSIHVMAQEEKLRVTLDKGMPLELDVNDVKDITFVEDLSPLNIVGEWFCIDAESGMFASFDFHEDGTLNYYCYNELETETVQGTWYFEDYILDLKYMDRKPIVPIINHSETAFVIRENNRNYTYIKVQKTYNMSTVQDPISIGNDGDEILYVDNAVIGLEDNKIKAIQQGYGFALVKDSNLKTTIAYRVNVEYVPGSVIDWTKYFKKSKDEIIAEFGTPNATQSSESMGELIGYTNGYNAEIKQLTFVFDKNTGNMYMVQAVFRGFEELTTYEEEIKKNYNFLSEDDKTRYYNDSSATTSISVRFKTSPYFINYMDLSE